MYSVDSRHSAMCGSCALEFSGLGIKEQWQQVAMPLMGGGFYTANGGQKLIEITLTGKICREDRRELELFAEQLKGVFTDLEIDGEELSGCTLAGFEVSQSPDSLLDTFKVTVRRVEDE